MKKALRIILIFILSMTYSIIPVQKCIIISSTGPKDFKYYHISCDNLTLQEYNTLKKWIKQRCHTTGKSPFGSSYYWTTESVKTSAHKNKNNKTKIQFFNLPPHEQASLLGLGI